MRLGFWGIFFFLCCRVCVAFSFLGFSGLFFFFCGAVRFSWCGLVPFFNLSVLYGVLFRLFVSIFAESFITIS